MRYVLDGLASAFGLFLFVPPAWPMLRRPGDAAMGRGGPFGRVEVDFLAQGGTRVSWALAADYVPAGTLTFQLQVGSTPLADADDWADVGSPVIDTFAAIDTQRRQAGPGRTVHYRVVLTDDCGSATSPAVQTYGRLSHRDWSIAADVARRAALALEQSEGLDGWLFKRRRVGPVAPSGDPRRAVTDPITGAVLYAQDVGQPTSSYGTDRVGGYFTPVPLRLARDPVPWGEQVVQGLGTTAPDQMVSGRAVAWPRLDSRDVFAAAGSDVRYEIVRIQPVSEVRGVPVVVSVDLSPLSPDHAAYSLAVPELES